MKELRDCGVQLRNVGWIVLAAACVAAPDQAFAVPNFARKYGTSCSTCHSPAVSRLNVFGHQFRKMGYRMENEVQTEAKPAATPEVKNTEKPGAQGSVAAKPMPYKEIGDYLSFRLRTGYAYEHFNDKQAAGAGGNSYDNRNGFRKPDFTVFFAGALTENLSMYSEIEWGDTDEIGLQAFAQWFGGSAERYYTLRIGQMHTLSRIGWAGFDRSTGITTPDVLSAQLTGSPVPFKMGNDQRGAEITYGFTPDSRLITAVYNGMNRDGSGNAGNGQGFGDSDGSKDALLAYEQMIGESGFTLFSYYGDWSQAAGTMVKVGSSTNKLALADNSSATDFSFYRLGATASAVFDVFDRKAVGSSELQGGYVYATDNYPSAYPTGEGNRSANALWVGVEQRLPHDAAVFYRYDYVDRSAGDHPQRSRHTLGGVYTVREYLRLAAETFAYSQVANSYGFNLQAMLSF